MGDTKTRSGAGGLEIQGAAALTVVTRGQVGAGPVHYAERRLRGVIADIGDPVLMARAKLTMAPDPAVERRAIAQVTVDIDGEVVRAQVSAHGMTEAVDLLQARLRDKLQHRAEHRRALRRRPASPPEGEWRHGDPPTSRPPFFVRPPEEQELVRRTSYAREPLTAEEAAFDMDELDYDFHLYRDATADADALLERGEDGMYRVTLAGQGALPAAHLPTLVESTGRSAPELTVDDAVERLRSGGERFVFFSDAESGRGSVLYVRYDGHLGLVTLA